MALSIVVITKNSAGVIGPMLASIKGLGRELLVSDDFSWDGTDRLVREAGGVIFHHRGKNLGERKQALVDIARGEWILILDTDERVSPALRKEILKIQKSKDTKISGYFIPYQNYVFGHPVYYGGENYAKLRLFRKSKGSVDPFPIHEDITVKGKIGQLEGKISHHSFRNPFQLMWKFTKYAWQMAGKKKNERMTLAKLFLYGPHMFWARFIKDQGYKDGFYGFVLALAFAGMETAIYWFALLRSLVR